MVDLFAANAGFRATMSPIGRAGLGLEPLFTGIESSCWPGIAAGLFTLIRSSAREAHVVDVEFTAPRCSGTGLDMPNMPGRLVDIGEPNYTWSSGASVTRCCCCTVAQGWTTACLVITWTASRIT